MTEPSAEELRRRLYRPGAGPSDVEAYRTSGPTPPEADPEERSPSHEETPRATRRAVVLAVPLALIAGGVAATPLLRRPRPVPSPTPPPDLPMLQIDLGVVDARRLETSSASWASDSARRAREGLERSLVQHAVPAADGLVVVATAGGERDEGEAFEADLRRSDLRAGDRFVLTAISRDPAFVRGRIEGRRASGEPPGPLLRIGRLPAYGGRMAFAAGSLPAAAGWIGLRLTAVPRTRFQVRFQALRPVD